MLRIVTSLLRNAPGPFKGPRALAADLLEGIADVISPPRDVEQPPLATAVPPREPERRAEPEPVAVSPERVPAKPAAPAPVAPAPAAEPGEATATATDLDAAFARAIADQGLMKRQDVKVLAIFWQARRRTMGPITAKAATRLGTEIGLPILHGNVRKVVRTRLKDKVATTTIEGSQPPTFEYELRAEAAAAFEQEILGSAS
jgi:hypothetical protein